MKFGTNYASLRIPYGDPLRVIQFRFGEYETSDAAEIELLTNHPETFQIGGDVNDVGSSNGDKKPKSTRKSGNTRKRSDSIGDGQPDSLDGEHRDIDGVS